LIGTRMTTIASQQGELKLGDLLDPNVIYESPDGGKTVYARIGRMKSKMPVDDDWYDEAMRVWRSQEEQKRDYLLLSKIWMAAKHDIDLAAILDQAKALYLLKRTQE
jgi:hypothetical protein